MTIHHLASARLRRLWQLKQISGNFSTALPYKGKYEIINQEANSSLEQNHPREVIFHPSMNATSHLRLIKIIFTHTDDYQPCQQPT